MEIELHSTKRAQERELFEERIREAERRKAAEAEEEAKSLIQRELAEVRNIRKQTEFKARPLPKFIGKVIQWEQKDSEPNDMMELG